MTLEGARLTNLETIIANRCRDIDRRLVRLTDQQRKELSRAWTAFDTLRTAFALNTKRSNFTALEQAGRDIIAAQSRLGVWLIHPANVGPGLKADDTRIVD